jgi:hypothetical protein
MVYVIAVGFTWESGPDELIGQDIAHGLLGFPEKAPIWQRRE